MYFCVFARWSLPLMQAKRNFRSLKSLILRRRPAIPWFHCRQYFVSGFVFYSFFNFSYALSLSLRLFISFFSISLPFCAGALFGGGGSCRRQGKSAAPDGPAWWRWLVGSRCLVTPSNRLREEKRGGGWSPQFPAPAPPGPAFARGIAKMGGPGAGGFWRGFVVSARCRLAAFAKGQPFWRFCFTFDEKGVRVVIMRGSL